MLEIEFYQSAALLLFSILSCSFSLWTSQCYIPCCCCRFRCLCRCGLSLSFCRIILQFFTTCNRESKFPEKFLYIVPCLRGYFEICKTKFPNSRRCDWWFYATLPIEVAFVSNYHNKRFFPAYFSDIIDPLIKIGEGIGVYFSCEVLVISKTMTAALESLIYEGMREWKRSCPAVSQSCILKLLFSTLIVLDTKSTPTVGFVLEGVPAHFLWNCRRWNDWLLMFFLLTDPPVVRSCILLQDCFTFSNLYKSIGHLEYTSIS